jgi:hypothetical protein
MRLSRSADVIWREIDQHGVLLRVSTGDYCEINEVGLFVWQNVGQDTDAHEIAERVAHAFDVDAKTAAADVSDFVRQLQKQEMISVRP